MSGLNIEDTLKPYEEVGLVSKLPQFIHLILKNLFFTLLDISRGHPLAPIDYPCAIWLRSVESRGSRSRTNKRTNGRQTQIIV